jgi:hypothetical protein
MTTSKITIQSCFIERGALVGAAMQLGDDRRSPGG